MGNLQVRFLEGWAPAMAPGYSTLGITYGFPHYSLRMFRWGGLQAAPRCGSADRSLTQQAKQEIDHGDGSP